MERTDLARKYLTITEKYDKTTKEIIINNFERIFGESGRLRNNKDMTRSRVIMSCTGCTLNTVQAWFNRGRKDLKITLEGICKIVEFLKLDVDCLIADRGNWREEDLTNREVCMFETLRKKQYFGESWWNFYQFAEDMHKVEYYPAGASEEIKRDQLYDDMIDYFTKVIGYAEEDVTNNIIKAVNAVEF